MRLMGEFAQKMKWEAICQPTEMKQGYDDQGACAARHLLKPLPRKSGRKSRFVRNKQGRCRHWHRPCLVSIAF